MCSCRSILEYCVMFSGVKLSIRSFVLFSPLVPSKMRFFVNFFFIFQPVTLKFGTGIQNWMLILIFGSKSDFGDDFGQCDKKLLFYAAFWPNAFYK